MLLDRSCGGPNISPGEWVNYSDTPQPPTTVSSNHVPWLIIGICTVACVVLLYSIRLLLEHENKRRDAEPPDCSYDDVYVMKTDDEGKRVEVKVSKVRSPILNELMWQADMIVRNNRSSWI